MRLLPASAATWESVTQYSSAGAATTRLADGAGEAHAYVVRFEPGGVIGRHEAGFGQLWIVVQGNGWVAGDDNQRHDIGPGDIAFFERGEQHAKGTDSGMTVVMVQVRDLTSANPS